MHRQRLGVQLDSGDLRVQFPGAIVLIVIGVLCGIGVGVFQGSRSGDEVGGSGERLAIRGVGGWRWSGRVARPDRELQIGRDDPRDRFGGRLGSGQGFAHSV
jgi:hypothetical protein